MILLSVTTIISSVFVFLFVIITLVGLLLFVKAKLSPSGKIKIKINGEKEIEVDGGGTLLSTLSNEGIFLPSACGGRNMCSMYMPSSLRRWGYFTYRRASL